MKGGYHRRSRPSSCLQQRRLDYTPTATHARTGAPALGRHPVVIYSPGFKTSRLLGTNHVEELVSRGYVVVTVDHTGEAPVEFPGGRVAPVVTPDDTLEKATGVRVADTRFVLDALESLAAGRNRTRNAGRCRSGCGTPSTCVVPACSVTAWAAWRRPRR